MYFVGVVELVMLDCFLLFVGKGLIIGIMMINLKKCE